MNRNLFRLKALHKYFWAGRGFPYVSYGIENEGTPNKESAKDRHYADRNIGIAGLRYRLAECNHVIRFQSNADFLTYGMIVVAGYQR